jgi:hypothetical protein
MIFNNDQEITDDVYDKLNSTEKLLNELKIEVENILPEELNKCVNRYNVICDDNDT